MYQKEWDIASYHRKFLGTMAWTKIGDGEWHWHYIGQIKEGNAIVYDQHRPIGQLLCECSGNDLPMHDDLEKYPIVQLGYKEIFTGAYLDKNERDIWMISKKHQKSYKIGLSDETHLIRSSRDECALRASPDIDLTRPITEHYGYKKIEVFNHKLVRIGTKLYADGDSIGFMDEGKCLLRSLRFLPLINKYLEGKWQIVSL